MPICRRRLGAVGLLATRGPEAEAGAVVGLLALAVAAVVALRLGVMPFHLRVSRLADVAPPISLPLLLAWIAVPLGVAAIAITDRLITPLARCRSTPSGRSWSWSRCDAGRRGARRVHARMTSGTRSATWSSPTAASCCSGSRRSIPRAWGPTRGLARGDGRVQDGGARHGRRSWRTGSEPQRARTSAAGCAAPRSSGPRSSSPRWRRGLPGWVAFEARGDLARLAAPTSPG